VSLFVAFSAVSCVERGFIGVGDKACFLCFSSSSSSARRRFRCLQIRYLQICARHVQCERCEHWVSGGSPVGVVVVILLLLFCCCCYFVVVILLLLFCCCCYFVVVVILLLLLFIVGFAYSSYGVVRVWSSGARAFGRARCL